jgi:selenide,water dikinase
MTTLNKVAAEVITGTVLKGTALKGRGFSRAEGNSKKTGASAPVAAFASDERRTTNDAPSVHALTDVTGFGLIGHAREMALASKVSLVFYSDRLALLEGALDCVRAGYIPGGLKANREFAECLVSYAENVPADLRTLLFDPQTAGGLLISVSPEGAASLSAALHAAGIPAVEIGEVLPSAKLLITVR